MTKDNMKVFIRTLGCQMNERDSEVIKGLLTVEGYKLTDDPREADVVLLNTCSVRQHAEDKAWSEIDRFGRRQKPGARSQAKKPVIAVIGCMAQNYTEEFFTGIQLFAAQEGLRQSQ